MFARSSLLVLTLVVLFSGLARASFPACAQPCIGQGNLGGCSATDNACLCKSAIYCNATNNCFRNSCSQADWKAAYDQSVLMCQDAGVYSTIVVNPPPKRTLAAPEVKRTFAPVYVRTRMRGLHTEQALPDELRFIVAVASNVALFNPPTTLMVAPLQSQTLSKEKCDVVDWWRPAGEYWLNDVCAHLGVDPRILPPNPSVKDAEVMVGNVSPEDHLNITSALLTATIVPSSKPREEPDRQPRPAEASEKIARAFGYTAASRALLARTLELLCIPIGNLLEAEKTLGRDLFQELKEAEMKEKSEAARKEQEEGWGGKWGRWAATGGGVILGGMAIGLTGGLAAPALVPLLPFLSASTAPIVLGSLFGVAGGGLAGNRVRKRWGGVELFEFEQIAGGNPDSVGHEKTNSYAIYQRRGQTSSGREENLGGKEDISQGKRALLSLVATICIPGICLRSEDEGLEAYKNALDTALGNPTRDVFVLKHSPDVMLSTGEALNTWIQTRLLSKVGKEVISRTAFNAVLAVVSLPMMIYRHVPYNDWIRSCDKARKAGNLLSEVLKEKVQGERPITIVASSLGAMALFKALLVLADSGALKEPLIDSVFLISLPQVISPREWTKSPTPYEVVARRIVNVYSSRDFVLAGVGRLHEVISGAGFGGMAGLNAVNIPGIEDVNVSGIVEGHFDINSKLAEILQGVRVNE
ncbi:membrane protein [Ceratobasidium theobromae]|uniref:Membrane protein n=1 Tax=Ceratobasidium theobromae TaxID=1582974 RepID=A0A5N5QMR4_9AGAM|nr:membrane protein [Ceratobasidium theobromae]